MDKYEYSADPCGASSLPFWKTELVTLPRGVRVIREDAFSGPLPGETDEPYFKLLHRLESVPEPRLPDGFAPVSCGLEELAAHINSCYEREHVTARELEAYRARPVFRPELWIAVRDTASGAVAASGIAELDPALSEGVLEWIQVSPGLRRRGLGSFIVCELLKRLKESARFVTVSGRMESESRPFELYTSCGFEAPVIWHVITAPRNGDASGETPVLNNTEL